MAVRLLIGGETDLRNDDSELPLVHGAGRHNAVERKLHRYRIGLQMIRAYVACISKLARFVVALRRKLKSVDRGGQSDGVQIPDERIGDAEAKLQLRALLRRPAWRYQPDCKAFLCPAPGSFDRVEATNKLGRILRIADRDGARWQEFMNAGLGFRLRSLPTFASYRRQQERSG